MLSGEPWKVGWTVFLNVVMSCDCVEYPCPWERRTEMFRDENPKYLLFVFDSLAEGKYWKYEVELYEMVIFCRSGSIEIGHLDTVQSRVQGGRG